MAGKKETTETTNASKAIIQTIIYSDLFDFTLTKDELWRFLKSDVRISRQIFDRTLRNLTSTKKIITIHNYFCLPGRETLVQLRKKRTDTSRQKLSLAQNIAKKLQYIPTILYIGISGSLAMNNTDDADDIDLFLIVQPNTIWISRLVSLLLLQLFGVRRKKTSLHTKNTVCINMIIDTTSLRFPKEKHDIYIAHEIAQVKTLFERNDTHSLFIHHNTWISGFMPNTVLLSSRATLHSSALIPRLLSFGERIAKVIQIQSIRRSQTTETVTDTVLAFHPRDHRDHILQTYKSRLKQYFSSPTHQ